MNIDSSSLVAIKIYSEVKLSTLEKKNQVEFQMKIFYLFISTYDTVKNRKYFKIFD